MEKLKASKGRLKTEFTPAAWRAMGKNKEGWKLDSASGSADDAAEDVENVQKRAKLIDAAEGLQKDGDHTGAKAKLMEAQSIKDGKDVKKLIADSDKAARADYITKGNEAKEKEDFTTALEQFGMAQTIKDGKDVKALISEMEEALNPSEEDADLL